MHLETFSAAVMLFFVMDPLGNIPPFLTALNRLEPSRRRHVLVRELLVALVVLLAFLYAGNYFLDFLHIRQEAIAVSGGIILFLIALSMVFPKEGGMLGPATGEEPFIVPLAIPLVAGPSAMATLLLLVKSDPARLVDWTVALIAAWCASSAILLASTYLYRILRPRGLVAMERLIGMVLVVVSVQMFLDGLTQYLNTVR